MLLSARETARNLLAMRLYAGQHSDVKWVWITPSPVDEIRIANSWFWQALQTRCANRDIEAIAEFVRHQADPVVDLSTNFDPALSPTLLLDDGLHPSLAGHERIVRGLLKPLSEKG